MKIMKNSHIFIVCSVLQLNFYAGFWRCPSFVISLLFYTNRWTLEALKRTYPSPYNVYLICIIYGYKWLID